MNGWGCAEYLRSGATLHLYMLHSIPHSDLPLFKIPITILFLTTNLIALGGSLSSAPLLILASRQNRRHTIISTANKRKINEVFHHKKKENREDWRRRNGYLHIHIYIHTNPEIFSEILVIIIFVFWYVGLKQSFPSEKFQRKTTDLTIF